LQCQEEQKKIREKARLEELEQERLKKDGYRMSILY